MPPLGEEILHSSQESHVFDLQPGLLEDFALGALFERFAVLEVAACEAVGASLVLSVSNGRRESGEREGRAECTGAE